uniref:Uncharacterized protein n=1 Tax=viral metagenome TaxID=1070528 RepID=A0A6M3XYH0_9ZZZZ
MGKWIGKEMYDEEKPCFQDWLFSFGQDDDPMECLECEGEDGRMGCSHLHEGGTWENCEYGACSSWYMDGTPPQRKKGAVDA